MSQPAARVSDMHTCPMQTPGVPPIPHVGGPVLPPGATTVMLGGLPAARVGDLCTCVGPPDAIVKGSATVFLGGQPAARMGDSTSHGGAIVGGFPTVLIGDQGRADSEAGAAAFGADAGSGLTLARAQEAALRQAAEDGAPFCEVCERARRGLTSPFSPPRAQALRGAAATGVPFCEECETARRAVAAAPVPGDVSPAAQRAALAGAAAGGTPFCEECARHPAGGPSA